MRLDAGIEIDFCDSCKGTWFDKRELDSFLGFPCTLHENTELIHSLHDKELKCPKCRSQPLEEVYVDSSESLKVDLCQSCYGIWLDQNEIGTLKKIMMP
jgi:Zn-finger nucleic acid-binding protein